MIQYKHNIYATRFHPEADSRVFEVRIIVDKEHGYFPTEQAEKLIEKCNQQRVHVPEEIIRNFV